MLCATMLVIAVRIRPVALVHECTRTFPHQVLTRAMKNYVDYHQILDPMMCGAPVRRARSYDCLLRWDHKFDGELEGFEGLNPGCCLDCGVFLQAPREEAGQPAC